MLGGLRKGGRGKKKMQRGGKGMVSGPPKSSRGAVGGHQAMCTGARLLGGTSGGTEGCRSGSGRLLAASQKTLCLPSSPPYPPPFLLQLIPHFLSKIPRELLVCVFPQHVLICHPRSLTGLCSAGASGAPSLQLAAVPRPAQWCHQQGQVPPAPRQEPPSPLPVPIQLVPSCT